jgi:hypothetical protein
VIREEESRPRERRTSNFFFERVDNSKVVPDVGFVPFIDYEFTLTWVDVPEYSVPITAIANCNLKINNAAWDINKDGTYGRYKKGTLLFCGIAGKVRPHRGPDGSWLKTLPYVFRWQPGDNSEDTFQKIPIGLTWVEIRRRDTAEKPYGTADFDTLFQPEPL